ncbi:sensor histidine kinase [Curtobacterium sp. VKM Ac-1395]|uniref:sensor histidine kinase n=1 Tax=Curtobacterium sp. VKM Ac-1395 TaxID=2783815 RepID=UPI00188D0994|nr:HAMP domain-containing sensor histidine kinase [Curtobacterium sp. VKM Ac-1395]MBF4588905.1 HAMP domain-containing histidine kinase [Curtobacterium sp. VKM Ac-1395]
MAFVSAALVFSVIVLVVAYLVWQLTPAQQHEPHGPEDIHVYLDTVDLLIAVIGVGVIAVLMAGAATWVIARRAVRPLAEAYRLQRTFVADASHELRTPLTVLSARVQELQSLLPPGTGPRVVADELRTDTKALVDVVDDLLATAAGRLDEHAVASLEDALHGAAADLQVLAQERDVQLFVAPGTALVHVTPTQLRRCLVALIDNAIGHSRTGGAVWVENERSGDDVDRGTLIIEGGNLLAASPDELTQIGFLTPERTVADVAPGVDLHLPVGFTTVAEIGMVTIDAFAHATEPPLPDGAWTDVVDVTFDVDGIDSGLTVVSLFDGPDFDTPPLTPAPGLYRLRIIGRGRERVWIDTVHEQYRFDAWPIAAPISPTIHRAHNNPA